MESRERRKVSREGSKRRREEGAREEGEREGERGKRERKRREVEEIAGNMKEQIGCQSLYYQQDKLN
jgi:hypothetical protein